MLSLRFSSKLAHPGPAHRVASYVTASTTKKVVAKKATSSAASKKAAAAAAAAAPPVEDIELPEELFDPPEFGMQVGQSQRSSSSKSTETSSPLGSTTLSHLFKMSLHDLPPHDPSNEIHWPTSFYGLAAQPFPEQTQEVLAQPIAAGDIEIKPDGLIYLPEIKYRRILNKAFGAGGWGIIPRSETLVTNTLLTREYALVCLGRLVSVARGEQDYFSADGIPTATEGCRSNALMRCCKDLGIASELWDPNFIRAFKKEHCEEKFVEHVTTKRKRKIWKRKDRTVDYPYKVT